MSLAFTHRGFLVGSGRGPGDIRPGYYYANPAMNRLYEDLVSMHVDRSAWEWRKKAIETLQDMFDKAPNFFSNHITGGFMLPPRVIDFLHGTLVFIQTGRRPLSVYNWMELLDIHPSQMLPVSAKVGEDFAKDFGGLYNKPIHQLLPLWLCQEGGLEDAIISCLIMFGSIPDSD